MKIKDIGGEFALIDRITAITSMEHADLIAGVGDDAAVIRTAPEPAPYLLVSTDILVEERHYKRQWADATQIGIKAVECNVSDIAAMGGIPTWMFVSLVLPRDVDVAWTESLYRGIHKACRRHSVIVAGGDTTQGQLSTINITLLGHVAPADLCLRSHARPGDLLMVTGTLGASASALALLLEDKTPSDYLLEKHLTPACRLAASRKIAPLANAMIDISDGLGSEVHHICRQSKVDAEIEAAAIPLHADVIAAAKQLGTSAHLLGLSGGEDFELLFSIKPENARRLDATGLTRHAVGKVVERSKGPRLIEPDGTSVPLPGGYDHFKS